MNAGVTDENKRLYANNDSTAKEREQLKKLREEKKGRTDEGETDLVIRRGRGVIKRPPKSLHLALRARGLTVIDETHKQKQNMSIVLMKTH